MAYSRPDIYIEEILSSDQASQGVSTSVAAFYGFTERGPTFTPVLIRSVDEFRRTFGGEYNSEALFYSVRSFFENGGSNCYVVRMKTALSTATARSVSLDNNETVPQTLLKFTAGFRGSECLGDSYSTVQVNASLSGRFVSSWVLSTSSDMTADAALGDEKILLQSINGITPNAVLMIEEGASSGTATKHYAVVKSTESYLSGSSIVHAVNLTSGLTSAITSTDVKVTVLEYDITVQDKGETVESWRYLSFNQDADNYIETIINDSQTGSRFVKVEDLLASTPSYAVKVLASSSAYSSLSTGGGDETVSPSVSDFIGSSDDRTGFYAISGLDSVNLLCVPPSFANGRIGSSLIPSLHNAMLAFCAERMNLFAILDTPADLLPISTGVNSVGDWRKASLGVDSYWGALYYPHIKVPRDGVNGTLTLAPSGAVAGIYARMDAVAPPQGSVSTAPAGYGESGIVKGIKGIEVNVDDAVHGDLNLLGINVLRKVNNTGNGLPGVIVLGARTLSSTSDFRYVNVRRMMTYVEQSVKTISKPYLFKNNGPETWSRLTNEISSLLNNFFLAGQLAGNTSNESFFVKIDSTNNSAEDLRNGILNAEIGLALLRPAEFIIFRFSQSAGSGATVQE